MPSIDLTRERIDAALPRVEPGLEKYTWLQEHFRTREVTSDADFQRRFNGFYRVRRGPDWQRPFYALLERCKHEPTSFADVLHHLQTATGRVEASFASKLVATVDPSLPIIDSVVLQNVGLRLPAPGVPHRLQRVVEAHEELARCFAAFLDSDTGAYLLDRFEATYPRSRVTKVKALDLVLWQDRS